MDNRDSFDGFDGLPLDLWAAQQLQAEHAGMPGMQGSLYQGGQGLHVQGGQTQQRDFTPQAFTSSGKLSSTCVVDVNR